MLPALSQFLLKNARLYYYTRIRLMAQNFPHIDRRMTNAVKKLFILPNAELLGSHCYDSLEMCANAATLDEFVR